MNELDIIIPVYNEAENIAAVLISLDNNVSVSFRVLICYDRDNDPTLPVVKSILNNLSYKILLVKNQGIGAHSAVITGFKFSEAAAVLVFPADDTENTKIIDKMYNKFKEGNDIVAASRFMEGGCMKDCPLLKSFLVRVSSFTLHKFAFIPIQDASNGFRLFSKRILDTVPIESNKGFTYSIELLVKAHRLRWKIAEIPAVWYEREKGQSHFHLIKWLPHYLHWYLYGFMTTYLWWPIKAASIKILSSNAEKKH